MNAVYRIVTLFLGLVLLLHTSSSFSDAQAASENLNKLADELLAPKRQSLDSKLEDRARQILSAQLDTGTYLVTVSSTIDTQRIVTTAVQKKNMSLKSLSKRMGPEDMVSAFAELQTPETLQTYVKKITIKLSLDKQVPAPVESLILQAMTESLGLNTTRGDEIKVSRSTLGNMTTTKAQEKLSDLGSSLRRVQDEKQSLEIKIAGYETQKIQLQEQIRQAHTETDRLKQSTDAEILKLNDQITGLKEQIKQLEDNALSETTFLGKVRRNIKGFEMLVTFVPVAVLMLIGLVMMTLLFVSSQGKRSRTMFDGLQILAGALQKAGIGGSSGLNALSSGKAQVAKENSSALDHNPGMVGEGAFELAKQETEEAWTLYTQEPYPFLSVLKDWLATADGATRFLAFSEAIGFAKAREIWKQFPAEEIEAVAKISNESVPKNIAFASVGQLLRLAESQRSLQAAYFSKLDFSFLIKVTDAHLAATLSKANLDLAAFALITMSPERAKRMLGLMDDPAIEELFAKMAAFKNLPEASATKQLQTLRAAVGDVTKQDGMNLTSHFTRLIENASPEQKNRMVRGLENDTELVSQIRDRVLSIEDVFSLEKDILLELFEPLETTQIAEIVYTLPQKLQGVVAGFLTQKMTFEVQQELARFQTKPSAARKAQVSGRRLQEMLCEAVKAQIEQGLVSLPQGQKARAS